MQKPIATLHEFFRKLPLDPCKKLNGKSTIMVHAFFDFSTCSGWVQDGFRTDLECIWRIQGVATAAAATETVGSLGNSWGPAEPPNMAEHLQRGLQGGNTYRYIGVVSQKVFRPMLSIATDTQHALKFPWGALTPQDPLPVVAVLEGWGGCRPVPQALPAVKKKRAGSRWQQILCFFGRD